MICKSCKVQNHFECENVFHPDECPTWCDCQHLTKKHPTSDKEVAQILPQLQAATAFMYKTRKVI